VSLLLYVDHHVRSAVVKGLRRRGIDVLTAMDDGHADVADDVLLARATELGRIVFTQDDDFLVIADAWQREGRRFAGLVYAHQLRATVGQIVADLQLILEASTLADLSDSVLFLPL
jgi:predicted nuclease of predicted toxin-antitoxin system